MLVLKDHESVPKDNWSNFDKDKIQKKNELRHYDPIGSLFALALAGLFDNENPKISRGNGRLYVKSQGAATEAWMPSMFQADELPTILQSVVHSVDRTWYHDGREDLIFFNEAIPQMAHIYPVNSLNFDVNDSAIDPNEILKTFWGQVSQGIDILRKSYAKEMLEPLIAENKISANKTNVQLPLQESLGMTFVTWKNAIDGYIKQEPYNPRFANVLEKIGTNVGEKEINSSVSQSSIAVVKNNTNEKKDELGKEKASLLEPLLIELQNKLFKFEKDGLISADSKILLDLQSVVIETIMKGTVPKKLHPLSEKVRQIWTLKDIQKVCEKIKEIKIHHQKVQRKFDLSQLDSILDVKALQYVKLVEDELDEAVKF